MARVVCLYQIEDEGMDREEENFPIFHVRFSYECGANFISSDKEEKAEEKYSKRREKSLMSFSRGDCRRRRPPLLFLEHSRSARETKSHSPLRSEEGKVIESVGPISMNTSA